MDSYPHDKLAICTVVHAGLGSQFFPFQDFRMFLMDTGEVLAGNTGSEDRLSMP